MKILSSEVNMQAHTSQDLDFKISRESSLDFKTFLYQPSSNKNDESSIETKKVNAVENKSIVHKEKELPLYDLINKFIIETLLSRFLGKYENNNKMYPNDECCCNCSEGGDKSDLNVLSESKQQTVIETKVRFSSETTTEYYKKNAISFNTQATIKTADKDIKIDLDLSYTQEFYESYKEKLEFEQSVFLDPLVIHYDLSSNYFDSIDDKRSFEFDINNDNKKDQIAMLKEGSGFLALDRNSNGTIDNGKELFGTVTNNGFDELAAYDEDKNGWIDESDLVFNDLRIWSKKADGEDTLVALSSANIGAIYLSDVSSTFNYDKSITQSMAHLKSTSIFLTEDGKAGLVTGVDFAVS